MIVKMVQLRGVMWACLLLQVGAELLPDSGCSRDSDCSSFFACLSSQCVDPCQTPCPGLEGGLCVVHQHRPTCSCPVGTSNTGGRCTKSPVFDGQEQGNKNAQCYRDGKVYGEEEHHYDIDCSQKCLCHQGEFLCEAITCQPGLLPRGRFSDDTLCQERTSPDSDDCCVLVVCAEGAQGAEQPRSSEEKVSCDDIICGSNAECSISFDSCRCLEGYTGDPNEGCHKPATTNREESLTASLEEPGTTKMEAPSLSNVDRSATTNEEDPSNISQLQITSTSIQVQFPDITGGNLMYVESRLVGRNDPPWENAIILEGNEIFTLTSLKPGTQYTLRWKTKDRTFPDFNVATLAFDVQKPKVIITGETHDSVTLAFDDFRPPGYHHGYVAQWRRTDGDQWMTSDLAVEEDGDSPSQPAIQDDRDTPSLTIRNLTPNTSYVAKVSIYDDFTNRVFGKSTEEIKLVTGLGCVHQGQSYPVGSFAVGCESSCHCHSNGTVACKERCERPLHSRGAFKDDPLCVESFSDSSECCVVVTCSHHAGESSPCDDTQCGPNAECKHAVLREEATLCLCQEGYTGDPDSEVGCALTEQPVTPEAAVGCLVNSTSYPPGEEWFDGCQYRCTCSQKLEILCQPRCKLIAENVDSRCELKPDPFDSCCQTMVCPTDNNNTDILQPSLPFDGCVFKNETYTRDERFYDGCDQQCQCMGYGDMVCLARCPPTNPGDGENCYTLPDVTDNCCNVTICDKPAVIVPDVEKLASNMTQLASNMTQLATNETQIIQSYPNETIAQEEEDVIFMTTETPVDDSTITLEKRPRFEHFGEDESSKGVNPVFVGEFVEHHHDVSGLLYILNSTSLLIKNFTYDGSGPDVFFWAGSSPQPSREGWILPYPFTGSYYSPESTKAPVLGRFTGEDIILHLPPQITLQDVKWLSVWCRFVGINFGEVLWPENFNADTAQTFADNDISEKIITKQSTSHSDYENDEVEPVPEPSSPHACTLNDQMYKIGEEFYDGCRQYCRCDEDGTTMCLDIECPSSFGLDVINPNCIIWDKHDSFVPIPPLCCPPVPVCISDGSCQYKGHTFSNYDAVPKNLTGCLQRCHCQDGEIVCQDACYKISEQPPSWVPCPRETAILVPNKERECCKIWGCPASPGRLVGTVTEPVNATSLAVMVNVPQSIDGAVGHYEIAFTSGIGSHPNPDKWPVKKLTPDGDRINAETGKVRLILSELLPNAEYFLRASLVLEDGAEPWTILGDIVNARTLPVTPDTTSQPKPEYEYLDLELAAVDITTNSAKLTWRSFEAEEKPYIDGVQLRYSEMINNKPVSQIHQTSPFIHRETKEFVLENLEPGKQYEVDASLIPVPNAPKEYISGRPPIIFETKPFIDVFDFKMKLVVENATSQSVDISWSGVPSPDQKFVHVYRLIYHANQGPNQIVNEASVFKISKIDSPKKVKLDRLQPGVSYAVWLEAYLTNGKTKESQVATFKTLPADLDNLPEELRSGTGKETTKYDDNYYNSMVAAAIVAAFAILAFIIVLYFYLRRNTTYKATITKDRPNYNPAYDNHGFKGYENDRAASPQTSQSIEMNGINGHASPGAGDPGKENP